MIKNLLIILMLGLLGCNTERLYSESVKENVIIENIENPIEDSTYKVRNLNLKHSNVVLLVDQVNVSTVDTAIAEISRFNSQSNKPIYLLINSPGGSVFDGARLITAMEASKNKVYTVCL